MPLPYAFHRREGQHRHLHVLLRVVGREGVVVRKHGRVDANQAEVVEALRKAGATVQSLASVGGGCPDLLVGYRGVNHLVEIKDGSKPPSGRRLTEDEAAWHRAWTGEQVEVIESVEDAMYMLQ